VISINGQAVPFTGYQDTVLLPPRNQDGTPSTVTVIMPFIDRNIVGKYVVPHALARSLARSLPPSLSHTRGRLRFLFHCHLLYHEDGGMMGVIVVNEASAAAASSLLPSLGAMVVLALALVVLAVLGA